MKNVYLVLAIAGAVVPYLFFIPFFAASGLDPGDFLSGAFVNGAAGGLAADLILTSVVFWVYLFSQRAERIWLHVLINLTIGLSCALPLYLYLTTRDAEAGTTAPAG